MTEPPYGRENHQRPKYISGLSWSGVPIFSKGHYVALVSGTSKQLSDLQKQPGVIDFPNVDTDDLDALPKARKTKNTVILNILKGRLEGKTTVKEFINDCANIEMNHGWDKDKIRL